MEQVMGVSGCGAVDGPDQRSREGMAEQTDEAEHRNQIHTAHVNNWAEVLVGVGGLSSYYIRSLTVHIGCSV